MMKKALVSKGAVRKSTPARSGAKKSRAGKRAKLAAAKQLSAMEARAARESEIRARYQALQGGFTERARRLFVANEAITFGYGGIVAAARATGWRRA
jgi:hypothetical protein